MSGRYGKSRGNGPGKVISLCLLLFVLGYIIYYWNAVVSPAIDNVAEIKARAILTQIVTEAMNDKFSAETNASDLLLIQTNSEGSIEMVQSNTKAINTLVSDLAREIQIRCAQMEGVQFEVPLGTVLGSKIWSQHGPNIDLTILPVSVSGMDFRTEFETQGINQTKYKVYVVMQSRAKVMAPFSDTTLELSNTILIAEAVILGKVPQSYVFVPEEDILDATEEIHDAGRATPDR